MAGTEAGQSATDDQHRPTDSAANSSQADVRGTLLLLVLVNAGALGLQGLLSPLTVELQRFLQVGHSSIAWIQTGFLIVYAAATPLWGLAAVHYSRRTLLILASLLWGTCCVCLAFAETRSWFSGLFWVAAVGNAAIIPLTWSMAVDLLPPDRRRVTFSWLATGQTLGMGCAFLLGGLLVEQFGEREVARHGLGGDTQVCLDRIVTRCVRQAAGDVELDTRALEQRASAPRRA